jgi:PAS domain S-box-containing protein
MLNKITLQTRLALGFCLVMVLMGAVGIFALVQLNILSSTNLKMYQHPFTVSNAVLRVSGNIAKIHGVMELILLSQDRAQLEATAREINNLDKLVLADFTIIAKRFLGDPQMYELAKKRFLEWRPIRNRIISLMRAGDTSRAIKLEREISGLQVKAVMQAVDALNAFAQNKAKYYKAFAEDSAKQSSYLLAALLALAIMLGTILTVMITRKVANNVEMEELQSRLEVFESTLAQLRDTAFWLDAEGRIIYANDSASRHTGYSNDELLAMSISDIDTGFLPETWPAYWRDLKQSGHTVIARNYRRKNDEVFPVEVSQSILLEGEQSFVSLVARDITKRKQAEEEIRQNQKLLGSLFETSPVWISLTKVEDGTFLEVNNAVVKSIGFSREELLGKAALDLGIWPDGQDRHEYKRLLLENGRFHNLEVRFRTKSGAIRDYDWSAEVIEVNGEKCSINVVQDMTEYKLAQKKLEHFSQELETEVTRRTAQLAAANKELEAFAYSVSHDLRAPLRAISGFSQAVLEDYHDKLDEEGQDYLRRIRDAGKNMGVLIDDILKLSRITRTDMTYKDVDLSRLASEIAETLTSEEPERKAEFHIQPSLQVQGDEVLLKVLLDNIMRNAWKFTSKKDQAKIEFGQLEQPHYGGNGGPPSRVYFVKDNGAGFDPSYQNKLFQPFQRLHRQDEFPGTGVGLATVQRVVTRHGGKIWAESQEKSGASFFFTLGCESS